MDAVKSLTMAQVHGVLVFFSTILSELVQSSVAFLEEETTMMRNQLAQMI
jgi:hypothetical protein